MTDLAIVIIVSAVIALIIAVIAAVSVVRNYSMKYKPVDYPFDQFTKLNLQEQSDRFIEKRVTSRIVSDDRDQRR